MAEFVGAFATSHGPLIAREWDVLPEGPKAKLTAAFDETGRRLKALEPDVLVMLSPDHWVNFFIDNLPSFCIGIGEEHDGPPEPFMKPVYPHKTLPGHPAFGRHLLDTALRSDFDPAISHRLTLDHGFCLPLWRMGIDPALPIVPITVNQLEEPLPTLRRCIAWGRMLRRAIESYAGDLRVAVLGPAGSAIGSVSRPWVKSTSRSTGSASICSPTPMTTLWLTGWNAHWRRQAMAQRKSATGSLPMPLPAAKAST